MWTFRKILWTSAVLVRVLQINRINRMYTHIGRTSYSIGNWLMRLWRLIRTKISRQQAGDAAGLMVSFQCKGHVQEKSYSVFHIESEGRKKWIFQLEGSEAGGSPSLLGQHQPFAPFSLHLIG